MVYKKLWEFTEGDAARRSGAAAQLSGERLLLFEDSGAAPRCWGCPERDKCNVVAK